MHLISEQLGIPALFPDSLHQHAIGQPERGINEVPTSERGLAFLASVILRRLKKRSGIGVELCVVDDATLQEERAGQRFHRDALPCQQLTDVSAASTAERGEQMSLGDDTPRGSGGRLRFEQKDSRVLAACDRATQLAGAAGSLPGRANAETETG